MELEDKVVVILLMVLFSIAAATVSYGMATERMDDLHRRVQEIEYQQE